MSWHRRKSLDTITQHEEGRRLVPTLTWPHLVALGIGAIVGTGNVLIYTCYADQNVRNALQNHLSMYLGKVTISDDLTKVPAKLLTSTSKNSGGVAIGLLPNNGFAPMPAQWATAINETFLTKVTTLNNPASLNLWIQDKLQKKSTDVLAANPTCDTTIGGATTGGHLGVN